MHRGSILSLIALLLLSTPGSALPSPGHWPAGGDARLRQVQNSDIGANGAAQAVRRATGGRVLAVTRVNSDSGAAYRVKVLLKGGRVRVLLVDAASGAIR